VSPGNDSRYYVEKVEAAQRLVNKLWNISRYILTSVDEVVHGRAFKELEPQTLADRWILSQLVRLEEEVSGHLQAAEFSQASEKLRAFTWNDFADWYLEISKNQLHATSYTLQTSRILVYVLEHLLTYWHPIMPFVTEQIWSYLGDHELLMAHAWPVMRQIDLDLEAEAKMARLQEVISAIRNIRSEHAVAPKQKIRVVMVAQNLEEHRSMIETLAGIEELTFTSQAPVGEFVSAVLPEAQVFVSLEGLVDKEAERAKLVQEQRETQSYIQTLEAKLTNTEFTSKAPESVVSTMRANLEEAKRKLATIVSSLPS
jgi:valyl-tRNA synthetase